MANSAQARKRARQADKSRTHNAGLRTKARTYIKRVLQAVKNGDKNAAQQSYKEAVSVIDKVSGKGLLHKNAAARYKSRLNARVKAL